MPIGTTKVNKAQILCTYADMHISRTDNGSCSPRHVHGSPRTKPQAAGRVLHFQLPCQHHRLRDLNATSQLNTGPSAWAVAQRALRLHSATAPRLRTPPAHHRDTGPSRIRIGKAECVGVGPSHAGCMRHASRPAFFLRKSTRTIIYSTNFNFKNM